MNITYFPTSLLNSQENVLSKRQNWPCTFPFLNPLMDAYLIQNKVRAHLFGIQGPSGCASVSSSLPPAICTNITGFPTHGFFHFCRMTCSSFHEEVKRISLPIVS